MSARRRRPGVLERAAARALRRLSLRLFGLAAKIRGARGVVELAQMRASLAEPQRERVRAHGGFFSPALSHDTLIRAHRGERVEIPPTYATAYLGLADLAREAVESGAFDAGKARELLGKIDPSNGAEMCRCGLEFFSGGLAKLKGGQESKAAKSLKLLGINLQVILRTVERGKGAMG